MTGKYKSTAKISVERVRELFAYDPETGKLTWKVRPSPRSAWSLIGQEAGNVLPRGHRYVSVDGGDCMASQIIWMLVHGRRAWGRIQFNDGDPSNLRLANLRENDMQGSWDRVTREGRNAYDQFYRALHPEKAKHKDLMRTFGISLDLYKEMLLAQKGCCAICEKPETATRNGRLKALAVDHDHESGTVRGLLCVACNTGIGKFAEDIDLMQSAIRYLRRHSGADNAVVPLKKVD